MRGELWIVELRRPHDAAVERVDGRAPRVRAERVRVARRGWAVAGFGLGLLARGGRGHEHLLRRLQLVVVLVLPVPVGGRSGGGALEPGVGFGGPAGFALADADALPDDAADVRVVDGAAERGLEGGGRDRFPVFGGRQADGLCDERVVPNGVEV